MNRELRLNRRHRKLGGVCAGVADYLDVPRLPIRIAALVGLVFVPQVTLIAYGLAFLILDDEPSRPYTFDQE